MQSFLQQELSIQTVYHFTDDSPAIPQDYGSDLDSYPTYATLRRFFRIRFEEPFLRSGDNLWFFFAGHGKRHEDRDYLMPIDADPGDEAEKSTWIPLSYITDRLRRSGADNIVMLVDACRSGEGRRDSSGFGQEQQQGVITLFACSPWESSYEIDELQQGAFTYALLQGLQIGGEGNCATVERLYQRLRQTVPQLTQAYKRVQQTPYGVVEPPTKYHLILLPRKANLTDIMILKNDALQAEIRRDFELAKQLWIRVLSVSPADHDAIAGIERLAWASTNLQILSSSNSYISGTEIIAVQQNEDISRHSVDLFLAIHHQSFQPLTSRLVRTSLPTYLQYSKIQHIELDQSAFLTNDHEDLVGAIQQQTDQLINSFMALLPTNEEIALGYYGIVHIPLQFLAGYAISTWLRVKLFELNRNTNEWNELLSNDVSEIGLSIKTTSPSANVVAVVIRIAISFDLDQNDIDDVVPQPYEDIEIRISRRRIDAITSYSQVNEICDAFRQVLDDLHARIDKSIIVHVFYAGPVSLGFSLGRRISRTLHHRIVVYNYMAQRKPRYVWGIMINNGGTPESMVVSTKSLTSTGQE